MDGGVAVQKILAPIDRSKYKEKIIAYAISLGKAWGAEITAIHVIDPGRGVPGAVPAISNRPKRSSLSFIGFRKFESSVRSRQSMPL